MGLVGTRHNMYQLAHVTHGVLGLHLHCAVLDADPAAEKVNFAEVCCIARPWIVECSIGTAVKVAVPCP
jgi:hypothetical protein